jgi:hypothetical protein
MSYLQVMLDALTLQLALLQQAERVLLKLLQLQLKQLLVPQQLQAHNKLRPLQPQEKLLQQQHNLLKKYKKQILK